MWDEAKWGWVKWNFELGVLKISGRCRKRCGYDPKLLDEAYDLTVP